MDDDLEPMPMHAPTLVAKGHIGEAMRGLDYVSAPDVCAPVTVEIHPFMRRALDTNLFDSGDT
jgi:hypothetical protein